MESYFATNKQPSAEGLFIFDSVGNDDGTSSFAMDNIGSICNGELGNIDDGVADTFAMPSLADILDFWSGIFGVFSVIVVAVAAIVLMMDMCLSVQWLQG